MLADAVRGLKDPRLGETIYSFTEVDVAPDFSHARVNVSVMAVSGPEGDAQKRTIVEILNRSAGYLQRELNREVRLRRIPHLTFFLDKSIEEGDRMTQLLRDVAHSEGRDL